MGPGTEETQSGGYRPTTFSPPEGTLGYYTCAQDAAMTKRRPKIGLSVA